MNVHQLRAAALDGQPFTYLHFWRPGSPHAVGPNCMSQWYARPFEDEGVFYYTAEHYMMAGKARLFGDEEALEALLENPDPAAARRWGRKVRGFQDSVWKKERFAIVVRGSAAKFGADERLRAYLLGTGDAVLVEASPSDRIWGIGLGEKNDLAWDPQTWRGQNLLGFALMEARDRLRDAG